MKTYFFTFIVSILCLSSLGVNAQTIDLFNGKDLSGWELVLQDPKVDAKDIFTVKDGVIHVKGTPFGYMQTEKEYDNFYLHVEWRWPEKATNSGIFVFVKDEKKVWANCIEIQLHNGDAGDFVLMAGADMREFVLPEGQQRPAFPVVKKKAASSENKVGEWNSAEIVCVNGQITVSINGVLQNMGTATLSKKGRIALQSEGEAIEFRHVRLTPFNFGQ